MKFLRIYVTMQEMKERRKFVKTAKLVIGMISIAFAIFFICDSLRMTSESGNQKAENKER